jgi:hypothetical protein
MRNWLYFAASPDFWPEADKRRSIRPVPDRFVRERFLTGQSSCGANLAAALTDLPGSMYIFQTLGDFVCLRSGPKPQEISPCRKIFGTSSYG